MPGWGVGEEVDPCRLGARGRRRSAVCAQPGQAYSHSPTSLGVTRAAAGLPPVPTLHSAVEGPRQLVSLTMPRTVPGAGSSCSPVPYSLVEKADILR